MEVFDFAAVIAAIIGAVTLLKTATIGYNERRQRAHWFFDEYVGAAGRYIECKTDKTKEEYYVWLFKYYIYADEFVEKTIDKIDRFIKKEQWEDAEKEVLMLTKYYKSQYSITQYLPRKRKRRLHFD